LAVTEHLGHRFANLPTFGNREIKTVIRLREGETNMLAGLIRDDERTTLAGRAGAERHPGHRQFVRPQHQDDGSDDIILTLTPTSSACWI